MQSDCTIELHRNWYSVPWRLLGESVRVVQQGERVVISHAAHVVAEHVLASGTRVRRVDPAHFAGITTRRPLVDRAALDATTAPAPMAPSTPGTASRLRPLSEYAAVAGEQPGWAA